MDGIGRVFTTGVVGVDLDGCLFDGVISQRALDIIAGAPRSYTEVSPSGDGLHIFWFGDYVVDPGVNIKCKLPDLEGSEIYTQGRFFTVTGNEYPNLSAPVTHINQELTKTVADRIRALKPTPTVSSKVEVISRHNDLNKLGYKLFKAGCSTAEVEDALRAHNKRYEQPKEDAEIKRVLADLKRDAATGKIVADAEIDPESWREGFKSYGELSTKKREYALSQLVPKGALTAIPGASFNCKTWVALAMGHAMSTGQALWQSFYPPVLGVPIPCAYHVPEMDEPLVREYMDAIGFAESENFLVRAMEMGLWKLNDPRMIRSSEGRVVFLDTAGYFNPGDDSSNYSQALQFALLIHNLLVQGAIAVVGLFHPPKTSNEAGTVWTLENSILGSAGYGGILRSCLRVKNLNPDLNDKNVWLYCQGMKNPGLKPFQLSGPPPLKMKVLNSPYLADLTCTGGSKYSIACQIFDQNEALSKMGRDGMPWKEMEKAVGCSRGTLSNYYKKWLKRKTDKPVDEQVEFQGIERTVTDVVTGIKEEEDE